MEWSSGKSGNGWRNEMICPCSNSAFRDIIHATGHHCWHTDTLHSHFTACVLHPANTFIIGEDEKVINMQKRPSDRAFLAQCYLSARIHQSEQKTVFRANVIISDQSNPSSTEAICFYEPLKIISFPLKNTSRTGHNGVRSYHWGGAQPCLHFSFRKEQLWKRTTNSNSSFIFGCFAF